MAIYHLTVSKGQKGAHSAVAKYKYISREEKYYKNPDEIIAKDSGNMPEWAQGGHEADYWKAADETERVNGRLYRQVEFALPKELSEAKQIELASVFCREISKSPEGVLPYSYAIHRGGNGVITSGTEENPHCHIMISERVNDGAPRSPDLWFRRAAPQPEQGGAKKTASLEKKDWLIGLRQTWAERANEALAKAGHDERIDHRSLEAQGVDREPTRHLGPTVSAIVRRQGWANHLDRNFAIEVYNRNMAELKELRQELEALETAQAKLEATAQGLPLKARQGTSVEALRSSTASLEGDLLLPPWAVWSAASGESPESYLQLVQKLILEEPAFVLQQQALDRRKEEITARAKKAARDLETLREEEPPRKGFLERQSTYERRVEAWRKPWEAACEALRRDTLTDYKYEIIREEEKQLKTEAMWEARKRNPEAVKASADDLKRRMEERTLERERQRERSCGRDDGWER